jgi:signal transduction histidine kinase
VKGSSARAWLDAHPLRTLGLAAAPLALAILFRPAMAVPWPASVYLPVHLVVEVLVVVVAASTFAVQWSAAGARLNDARARFIGSGFLAVALLELAHVLAFPGMPGLPWIASSTERGIVYWLAARLWTVGTLLGALLVRPGSAARAPGRGPLLGAALGGAALVLALDAAWLARAPRFWVEGEGLTPLKLGVEVVVAAAALLGAALHRRAQRRAGEEGGSALCAALALTVLSEICFMLYARAHDSFNLLGHAYLLAAAYAVFHALFAAAVLRPHAQLAGSLAEARALKHRIEDELEVTIRDLGAAKELQQDLLRAVSHDLRTPLQAILLKAHRLAAAPGDDGTRRAGAAIIAAGRHMTAIIQDLVDAAQLESGTISLARRPVALGAVVREVLSASDGALDTARVALALPEDLPAVSGDPARLARVVQNLLSNALRYSPVDAPVTVHAEAAGREVVLAVSDGGPGVPPEHLPRLFERFYRGAQRDTPGGLGLGLYVCRMLVEAHGGRIGCENRAEGGATFTVRLPAEHAPAPAPAAC